MVVNCGQLTERWQRNWKQQRRGVWKKIQQITMDRQTKETTRSSKGFQNSAKQLKLKDKKTVEFSWTCYEKTEIGELGSGFKIRANKEERQMRRNIS